MKKLWRRFWLWAAVPADLLGYYCAFCDDRVVVNTNRAPGNGMSKHGSCYECYAIRPTGSLVRVDGARPPSHQQSHPNRIP